MGTDGKSQEKTNITWAGIMMAEATSGPSEGSAVKNDLAEIFQLKQKDVGCLHREREKQLKDVAKVFGKWLLNFG